MAILLLILIFGTAIAVRYWQLSFFEFHHDQFAAILAGNETRAAHFLVTHGMRSGTGLDNPPFFYDIMGIFTVTSHDPAHITFYFFCLNLLALGLALIYFYRTLPTKYAVLAAAYLALFPAFIFYSNNIWAQCLLPVLMIVFNICLYKFLKDGQWWQFFFMGVLAVVAAQIHGSGFLLFLLLGIVAAVYWRQMNKKVIIWTLVAGLALFVPYLIHLFIGKEAARVAAYGAAGTRGFQWKILPFDYRMASFEFFRSYFKFDFKDILKLIAGPWRQLLYPLTFIPGIFFVLGVGCYIKSLFKGRLFDTSAQGLEQYPLPFQISGLMVLLITVEFMVLRVSASLHYCIVLFPAYSILTGFVAFKLWRWWWGKVLAVAGIVSTFILTFGILMFIEKAGGHPYEYGLSYKTMLAWKKEIQGMQQPGECFALKVDFADSGDSSDAQATASVLRDNQVCRAFDKTVPADVHIWWNSQDMRYQYTLERR